MRKVTIVFSAVSGPSLEIMAVNSIVSPMLHVPIMFEDNDMPKFTYFTCLPFKVQLSMFPLRIKSYNVSVPLVSNAQLATSTCVFPYIAVDFGRFACLNREFSILPISALQYIAPPIGEVVPEKVELVI